MLHLFRLGGLVPKKMPQKISALTNLSPTSQTTPNSRIHEHDSPCHSLDLSTGLSQIQTSTGWVAGGAVV